MKVHAIVDYSFLYYKYTFQLDAGRMRRLSANIGVNEDGTVIEKDISQIYYSIREIERFRKDLEKYGHEVVVSVCFDMPSLRKEEKEGQTEGEQEAASKYKANRVSRLGAEDYKNMGLVEDLLSNAGYNTYRLLGHEADDLVSYLVKNHSDDFDYNIIYTPDADLLVNITDKVGAMRFKATKGYSMVDKNNFEDYLSTELKCRIPYNSLMLFKCCVGDTSDGIDGIFRFGPKAFDKLVMYLEEKEVNWEEQGDYESTKMLLELCKGYLTDSQIAQALNSLSLVRPMIIDDGILEKPTKVTSKDLRKQSYSKLGMISLV